jgi:hypothetical protein
MAIRKRPAELDERPLVMGDMTKSEQGAVSRSVSDLSKNARSEFASLAAGMQNNPTPTAKARRDRYTEAAQTISQSPVSMEQAVSRRVSKFTDAATVLRKSEKRTDATGVTHKPESVGGSMWYFDNREGVESAIKGTSVPVERAMSATSRLSVRTDPTDEKAALTGLARAHTSGSVTFHPDVVAALAEVGHAVPANLHGQTVPFREVPATTVSALRRDAIRSRVTPHTPNVPLDMISRVGMDTNIENAHNILATGQGAADPHANPKQFGYEKGHVLAIPHSPEHHEYAYRLADIGAKYRGETMIGQQMFDYVGLRQSNEGILSNGRPASGNVGPTDGHTAEDTWMKSVTMRRTGSDAKVMGDLTVARKTRTTKTGSTESFGMGDKRITPGGAEHAFHHEATVRAAEQVQSDLALDYTVPSVAMQESTWAAARRSAPKRKGAAKSADTDWNNYVEAGEATEKRNAALDAVGGSDPVFAQEVRTRSDATRKAEGAPKPKQKKPVQRTLF